MLFPEEDAPFLKKWIVKRLENTSDADADVLADYVLALLRHDGDIETVRRLCEEEIPDFLQEDSSIFVRDVFDAIQYKSYLPGASTAPRNSGPAFPFQAAPSAPAYGTIGMAGAPRGPQGTSRKRSYNERGDIDGQDARDFQLGSEMNGRTFKQARRGGITDRGSGRFDFNGGSREGHQGQAPPMPHPPALPLTGFPNMPQMPSPPPGMPPLDPNNPMAAMLAMQAMGFPLPGMPQFPQSPPSGSTSKSSAPDFRPAGKRGRCRDYDTKGYCARGNACKFEHGTDSIYVPPSAVDEYDPSNSSLMTGIESGSTSITAPSQDNFNRLRGKDRGRGFGRGQRGDRGGAGGAPNRRGGRAEFSSDRPNFDRTKTTIVIENIPEEKFSEEDVRAFFTEFGEVTEVTMKPYKRLALVKFSDWSAAKAAYSSPKVIFDNRFVKVYWYTNPESLPQQPNVHGSRNSAQENGMPVLTSKTENSEPQINLEDFARKQQDVQKAHEEKMKKKADMEAAQKELEKRQEELLKNQAEEKRRLMERIAAKSGKADATPAADQSDTMASSNGKSSSQTEALRAQLAALEAEAKSLGLDTATVDDTSWGGRGRGRGRGVYRGRGAFVPRGYRGSDRGSYRGRGGAPYGGGAGGYKLDNRTKKVSLTGVDFTDPNRNESLRQYLLDIGEYTDLEATADRTFIVFKDRFTAEKFMYGTTNGELPSIGKVDLTWVQTPLPPVSVPKAANNTKEENGDEMNINDGDAMLQDLIPGQGGGHGQEQQELDYEVADDNDWGGQ